MTERRRNRRPSEPGEILKSLFMEQRNITVSELADAIEISRKHMSQIIHGKARIQPAIAARLGKALGTSTQVWLNLQGAVDAWDAEQEARDWTPARTFPTAA